MSERACGDRAGTHAGIDRHKAAGEALCATCAEFRRVYNQQYQMARRRAMGMRPRELQPCGTKAAAARRELHRSRSVSRERWWDRAACRGRASLMLRQQQPSTWFDHDSEKRRIQAALALCAGCPVQQQCLADAKAGWRLIGKQVGDVVGGVLSDEIGEKYGKGPGDGSRQRRKYLAIVKDINSLP